MPAVASQAKWKMKTFAHWKVHVITCVQEGSILGCLALGRPQTRININYEVGGWRQGTKPPHVPILTGRSYPFLEPHQLPIHELTPGP